MLAVVARPAPIESLGESQTWQREAWSVTVQWREGALHASIATVGRDGDLARDTLEEAWVEAALAGIDGVRREWGPDWILPLAAFDTFVTALAARCASRSFRLSRWDPALLAELTGAWSVTLYWVMPDRIALRAGITSSGLLELEGDRPRVDELRVAVQLDAPAGPFVSRQLQQLAPERALDVAGALGAHAPDALSWCLAFGTLR